MGEIKNDDPGEHGPEVEGAVPGYGRGFLPDRHALKAAVTDRGRHENAGNEACEGLRLLPPYTRRERPTSHTALGSVDWLTARKSLVNALHDALSRVMHPRSPRPARPRAHLQNQQALKSRSCGAPIPCHIPKCRTRSKQWTTYRFPRIVPFRCEGCSR